MGSDPHTVYYHTPVFKEDSFTPARMEPFNLPQMKLSNPQVEEKDMPQIMDDLNVEEQGQRERLIAHEIARRGRLSETERKRARLDSALTQICIFDGVTAYRVGGWENARSTNAKPVYEVGEYKDMGVRAAILTHGWVYCRWGRARAFPAITDDSTGVKIHGDAWRAGGFTEFAAVEGVVDWLAGEKAEREAKAEKVKERIEKEAAKGAGEDDAFLGEDELIDVIDDDGIDPELQETLISEAPVKKAGKGKGPAKRVPWVQAIRIEEETTPGY